MKLKDWTYIKEASWINKGTRPHLDKKIVRTFSESKMRTKMEQDPSVKSLPDSSDLPWEMYLSKLHDTTLTANNIYIFVELEDGTLVGFNESPSHGWSFPTGKWK